MTSMCGSAVASLDDAVLLLSGNIAKLEAATPADLAEMLAQFQVAVESGRMIRELLSAQLPDASWCTRAELELLLANNAQSSPDELLGAMPLSDGSVTSSVTREF